MSIRSVWLMKWQVSEKEAPLELFMLVLIYVGVVLVAIEDVLTKVLLIIKRICKTMKTLIFLSDFALLSLFSTGVFFTP